MASRILNSELVETFWDLAQGHDEKRVAAAKSMINVIKRFQVEDVALCAELEYALLRLVRGVSSPRKFARLGFAMALTQVLKEFPVVKPAHVINLAKEELQAKKSDKKNEASNIHLGRVMVCLCIAESGSMAKAENEDTAKLLKWLLKAKKQKPPLHQICALGMSQLIAKVTSSRFESEIFPNLEEILSEGWEKCSPDTLLLLLSSHVHHPQIVGKTFLSNHWKCKKLFSEKTWNHLADVISQSSVDHPIVHSVCYRLVEQAAQNPETFSQFWAHVINGNVLVKPGQKKYLCFQLVPTALRLTHTAEQVAMIMSPALVQALVKNLSFPDHLLHPASKQLVQELIKFVVQCPEGEKQVAVLTSLVSHPSSVKFDQLSKLNTISTMENALVEAGAQLWSQSLMSVIRGESTSKLVQNVDNVEQVKTWAISRLANIVTISSKFHDQDWQSSILRFLFTYGYFQVHNKFQVDGKTVKKCKAPLSKTCQGNLESGFSRALQRLATFKPEKNSSKDSTVYIQQVYDLVQCAKELLKNSDNVTPVHEMTDETRTHWNDAVKKIEKIHAKAEQEGKTEGQAFELLLMQLALQLFTEPESAVDLLQDVVVCYDKAFEKKRRSTVKKMDTEASWIEVLTEVLLSMMSKESAMVRTVTTIVFSKMCSHISLPALHLILGVLQQKKDEEDGPLGFEDSEDEDMEIEESENGGSSQEEAASSSEDEEDESEDDSEAEEDGDGEDPNETQVSELRAKLKAELGDAALSSDEEKSDDDFDDETMMKLDDKIAAAFRHMSKNKKAAKEEELLLMHFKNRCLDLLQQFVNSGPSVSLAAELVLPLLELMETATKSQSPNHKEPGQKTTHVFNALCKTRKFGEEAYGADKERLLEIFEALIELSTKVSGVPMVKNVGTACLLVMKMLHGGDDSKGISPLKTRSKAVKKEATHSEISSTFEKMLHHLQSALEDFCTKRDSKFSPVFFHHICERQPAMLWPLAEDLLEYISRVDVRIFCRTQACTTLTGMINRGTMQIIGPEEWTVFSQKLSQKLPKVMEELSQQEEYRPRYVHEALLVIHRVLNTDNTLKEEFSSLMKDHLETLMTKVKSENVALLRKIFVSLGIKQERLPKPGKRQRKRTLSAESADRANKTNHTESDGSSLPPKKKKRLPNQDQNAVPNGESSQDLTNGGEDSEEDVTEGKKSSKEKKRKHIRDSKKKRKSTE